MQKKTMNQWEIGTSFKIMRQPSIKIDTVYQHLLEVAQNEVPIVNNRLRVKLFSGRVRNLSNVAPPTQFFEAWMDADLLGHVKQFINKNLSGDAVLNSETLTFIQLEVMLSFYQVSPSLYFDLDERANFPST